MKKIIFNLVALMFLSLYGTAQCTYEITIDECTISIEKTTVGTCSGTGDLVFNICNVNIKEANGRLRISDGATTFISKFTNIDNYADYAAFRTAFYIEYGVCCSGSSQTQLELSGCLNETYNSFGDIDEILAAIASAVADDVGGEALINVGILDTVPAVTQQALLDSLNITSGGWSVIDGVLVQDPFTGSPVADSLIITPLDDLADIDYLALAEFYSNIIPVKVIQVVETDTAGLTVAIRSQTIFTFPDLTEVTLPLSDNQELDLNCDREVKTEVNAIIYDHVSSGTGTIDAGHYSVSISNVGITVATVQGETIPAGLTITFSSYLDPVSGTFKRTPEITYDVASSTLAILITP